MKWQFEKTTQYLAALMLGVLLTLGSLAQAADNIGVGDVAGDNDALLNSTIFQLFSGGQLTLIKTAWLTADGTPIASGATLPAGTEVDFMIYVNNKAVLPIDDVTISDTLNVLFSYTAGTIRVDNTESCSVTICIAAEEQAIYDAAIAAGVGTDIDDGVDNVSFTGGDTVDVGDANQNNTQQNAAADSVLAVVFTVTVQ